MLKEAMKNAIGVTIGLTIGGTILPRCLAPQMYAAWPPLWKHIILALVVNYIITTLTHLVMIWGKKKFGEKKENPYERTGNH